MATKSVKVESNGASKKSAERVLKEGEFVKMVRDWFGTGFKAQDEWRLQSEEAYRFVEGGAKQWDTKDLEILQAEKRPANTWNLILPKINILSGIMRGQDMDILAYPRGGDEEIARAMTDQIKYVLDVNHYQQELTQMFEDATICGLGWCEIMHDFEFSDDLLFGDVTLSRLIPFTIVPDPNHQRYDAQDCDWILKAMWMTEQRARQLMKVPKGDELKQGEWLAIQGSQIADRLIGTPPWLQNQLYDATKKMVRVLDVWYKEPATISIVVNTLTGAVTDFDTEKEAGAYAENLKSAAGKDSSAIRLIKRPGYQIRHAIMTGWQVFEDNASPFNDRRFPFVPMRGYQYLDSTFGIVQNLIDPQRDMNKRMSQALHILNTTANSGWLIPKNALSEPDKRKMEEIGSKPGLVVEYDGARGTPTKIEPSPLSRGHIDMASLARNHMDFISGIQPELAGQTSGVAVSGVPGKAVQARQAGSMVSVNKFIQNFAMTKRYIGEKVVKRIQQYHPPEKMMRIIGKQKMMGQQVPFAGQPEADITQKLADMQTLPMEIVVNLGPSTVTARQAQFQSALAMMQVGIPVPPDILIDLSDLPRKKDIAGAVATQGMQPPNPQVAALKNEMQGQGQQGNQGGVGG